MTSRLLLLLTTIACMLVTSTACGASALELHAKAAHATRVAMNPVADEIESTRKDEALAAARGAANPTEAEEAALEVDDRFAPIVDAQRATATAVETWVSSILLAAARDGDFPVGESLRLAGTVLSHWRDLARAAQHVGLEIPPPPDVLVALLSQLTAVPGDESRAPPPSLLAREHALLWFEGLS